MSYYNLEGFESESEMPQNNTVFDKIVNVFSSPNNQNSELNQPISDRVLNINAKIDINHHFDNNTMTMVKEFIKPENHQPNQPNQPEEIKKEIKEEINEIKEEIIEEPVLSTDTTTTHIDTNCLQNILKDKDITLDELNSKIESCSYKTVNNTENDNQSEPTIDIKSTDSKEEFTVYNNTNNKYLYIILLSIIFIILLLILMLINDE